MKRRAVLGGLLALPFLRMFKPEPKPTLGPDIIGCEVIPTEHPPEFVELNPRKFRACVDQSVERLVREDLMRVTQESLDREILQRLSDGRL